MSQQKTYFLAPNFTFKPYTGPIRLGSLIADPFRPHRVLTTIDEEALKTRYPRVERLAEYERSVGRTTDHSISIALWAHFLQTVNSGVSGERSSYKMTDYSMESLETEYFVGDPDEAEISARIMEPRVKAVIKAEGLGFRQPVYMISGLKIAKALSVRTDTGKTHAAGIENEVPIPTPIGDVGLGASVAGSKKFDERDAWKIAENIVFAYQLIKIEIKGWRTKRVEIDEFRHKAAYLDLEDENTDEDDNHDDHVQGKIGEVSTSAVAVSDLKAFDDEKLSTTEIVRGKGDQVSVVSFPDLK